MRLDAASPIERTLVMSVELNAYLFFPGNAEEAIAFYQEVFGGQVTITRLGDVDTSAPPTRIELSLLGTDDARLRSLFDGLANGGTVRAKLERQFWGDTFGAVTDRYGIG